MLATIAGIAMIHPVMAGGIKKLFTGKRSIQYVSERDSSTENDVVDCLENSEGPGIHVTQGANSNSWIVQGVPTNCAGIIEQLQNDKSHGTITVSGVDNSAVHIENLPDDKVSAFSQWASKYP